jgi:endonuclease YncB( thermonuclease family)
LTQRPDTPRTRWLIFLLVILFPILCGSGGASTVIGDQVELNATHQAGVPLHQEPYDQNNFQRIPDGTRARVIDTTTEGRWLQLLLPDGRTVWVTLSYVRRFAPDTRPPEGPSNSKTHQGIAEGPVTQGAGGDTITVTTANQTKRRISMVGIDAPEPPKGPKFPGQPYAKEAEADLQQLIEGKRVTVEIDGVDRDKQPLATLFLNDRDINLAMVEAGLAEADRGPESDHPYKRRYQTSVEVNGRISRGMFMTAVERRNTLCPTTPMELQIGDSGGGKAIGGALSATGEAHRQGEDLGPCRVPCRAWPC